MLFCWNLYCWLHRPGGGGVGGWGGGGGGGGVGGWGGGGVGGWGGWGGWGGGGWGGGGGGGGGGGSTRPENWWGCAGGRWKLDPKRSRKKLNLGPKRSIFAKIGSFCTPKDSFAVDGWEKIPQKDRVQSSECQKRDQNGGTSISPNIEGVPSPGCTGSCQNANLQCSEENFVKMTTILSVHITWVMLTIGATGLNDGLLKKTRNSIALATEWGLYALSHCPACRTTLVATRFRVAVICPIIQVPHCIRVFFYFVWFVFINHIFQFYYELCTYCNILDIYLS